MAIKFNQFVSAYNKSAKLHGVRETSGHGIVQRLNNADCKFNFASGVITLDQMKALFVYSYKGTQNHKDKVMSIFEDISEVFMLSFSFVEFAAHIEMVQDKEVKAITMAVKKMMDKIVFKTTLSKAVERMDYRKKYALDTDKKRIAAAREAILSLEDKAMLFDLFASKAQEEEMVG